MASWRGFSPAEEDESPAPSANSYLTTCIHKESPLKTTGPRSKLEHAWEIGKGMARRQASGEFAGEGFELACLGGEFVSSYSGEVLIQTCIIEHLL
ncbi:unnamed protein product [Fusarium graminearum]|uniref:Uncharacterized protein n=1 Tax=Gibberella zeae TaxID=5518 RepID=A0A4E9ELQ8_GIBZA|nr:unnamed protein product [Fusarium graminearum]CAG1969849.1 unnamed protein product [Fusarium graminearum]